MLDDIRATASLCEHAECGNALTLYRCLQVYGQPTVCRRPLGMHGAGVTVPEMVIDDSLSTVDVSPHAAKAADAL
jgi:hypothetical protein